MSRLKLKVQVVTPLFLRGADNETPELRPASFRGGLRYWLRTLLGRTHGSNLDGLQQAESALFGNTNGGSPIVVRTYSENGDLMTSFRRVLPHSRQKRFSNEAFTEGSRFSLEMTMRPGQAYLPDLALAALLLLLHLGGMGNRARRGFGSLHTCELQSTAQGANQRGRELLAPKAHRDGEALAEHLDAILKWTLDVVAQPSPPMYPADQIPDYPVLTNEHAKVLVCRYPFDGHHYHQAMVDFWDRLRSGQYHSNDRAFGYGMKGRRASPLLLHISRTEAGHHLVMTAFRSQPEPMGDRGWKLVSRFLEERAAAWDGRYLLGEETIW